MFPGKVARRFGNELYKVAFPIYVDRAGREILTRQLSAGCVAVERGAHSIPVRLCDR